MNLSAMQIFNMKIEVCLIIIWKVCSIRTIFAYSDPSTESELRLKELTDKYGYPLEIFRNVSTEDKYLLDVFRIPHGKFNLHTDFKPAVLLMHGLGGTARDFLFEAPEKVLPFLLADRNYDVWLGNASGTLHSRKHLVLNPDFDAKYWDFSWHEIGFYDLPAIINLIRNVTKRDKLSYVGISQGTTVFYVLTSARPEYNKNINLMVSLAPAVYMAHFFSPVMKMLATYEPVLTPLSRSLGIHEFPPKPLPAMLPLFGKVLCSMEGLFQDMCATIFFLAGGYDPPQLNKSIISVYLEEPSSFSVRQALHYAQNINSGEFRQFNFGRRTNLKKYGSTVPPAYNLSNVVSPVALFYSDGDWLVNLKDVERLRRELPNCVYSYKVPNPLFNHFDFLTAIDVVKLVFENVFTLLDEYNKNMISNRSNINQLLKNLNCLNLPNFLIIIQNVHPV